MTMSMAEKLTVELRRRIITGELAPASVVIEPALAAEFNVSKTPVREALQRLTHEHLVQVLPKRGYLVVPMSDDDVREIIEVRKALEPLAAWNLAGRVKAGSEGTQGTLDALRGYLGRLQEATNWRGALHAATAFHRVIAECSGNSRLAMPLSRIIDESTRALYLMADDADARGSLPNVNTHADILAAIAAGDAERAKTVSAEHLCHLSRLSLPRP